MTTKLLNSWNHKVRLPSEHTIFRATETCLERSFPHGFRPDKERGEWAIADTSGETPEQTESGILWLDFGNRIIIPHGVKFAGGIHIPVITPDGSRYTTVVNAETLLILSDMFRWTMNVNGNMYRAVRW